MQASKKGLAGISPLAKPRRDFTYHYLLNQSTVKAFLRLPCLAYVCMTLRDPAKPSFAVFFDVPATEPSGKQYSKTHLYLCLFWACIE